MNPVDLRRFGLVIDSALRRRQGIHDFTADRECLFRISLAPCAISVLLPDGTRVEEGDPIIELHLWNEHVPPMPGSGPGPYWASRIIRQANRSLFLLDRYLDSEVSLSRVAAVTGAPPFASRIGETQIARTGRRFGFEVLETSHGNALGEQLRCICDNLFLWGIGWTFNRSSGRHPFTLRRRCHLWISRSALHARYHRCDLKDASPRSLAPLRPELACSMTGSA